MPPSGDFSILARKVVALWVGTVFVGSFLLFSVQPMIAKMLLPRLGGAPAVWTTSVLFFQGVLLGGYAYAHWAGAVSPRKQIGAHVALLLVPLGFLPFRLIEGGSGAGGLGPALWLLEALSVAVGLPFLVLASGTPLLSRWLTWPGEGVSRAPYFLYAFSNAGSLLALGAYPIVVEPWIGLGTQESLWSWGYVLYALLVLACAIGSWKRHFGEGPQPNDSPSSDDTYSPSVGARLHWLVLAAIPSSLLLGVTAFITADVAATPFLWVIPLGLYLLTFILCFSSEANPSPIFSRYLPIAAVVYMLMWMTRATEPVALVTAGHLIAFFVAAMACHGQLYRLRPPTRSLSSYYLMIAVGGVAGGVFNTLLAPALFNDWIEYPLAFALACLLIPRARLSVEAPSSPRKARRKKVTKRGVFSSPARWHEVAMAAVVGLSTLLLVKLAEHWGTLGPTRVAMTTGLPVLLTYLSSEKQLRFGLTVGAVLWAGAASTAVRGEARLTERSFFGVHRVTRVESSSDGRRVALHELYHGTTIHGVQRVDPESDLPSDSRHPLGYYSETSAVGRLFARLRSDPKQRHIGLVGLGAGSLLAYAEPGEQWTVFEIDPVVQRIAEDDRYFTYLTDARKRGVEVDVILGDARVTLTSASAGPFDVLVLDAFSSGAIPLHLLTREAFTLYQEKLTPDGVLVLHISNRHLDLKSVVLAMAADLDFAAVIEDDPSSAAGVLASRWALLARDSGELTARGFPGATVRPASSYGRIWTDDYSDLWSVFQW